MVVAADRVVGVAAWLLLVVVVVVVMAVVIVLVEADRVVVMVLAQNVARVDYGTYLGQLERLDTVPAATKQTGAYRKYAADLAAYLTDFYRRARPLVDLDADLAAVTAAFDAAAGPGAGERVG